MKTLMATLILLASTTFAQAGVIFSDDFNRGSNTVNTVGNGWVETESAATDARIILGVELELTDHSRFPSRSIWGQRLDCSAPTSHLTGVDFLRSRATF